MKHIIKTSELPWKPKFFPNEDQPYGDYKALWEEHGTSQFEVRLTRIPPNGGTNTRYHTHTREEEWFYVTRGSCHICIEGEWCKIEQGDSVFKPAGDYHIFRNFGSEPCELIMLGTNVEGSVAEKKPEPAWPGE